MESTELAPEIEVEEFNNVLDKILDIFANGELEYSVEDEELVRAQEAYNKVTAEARENDAKRAKWEFAPSIPKIMKNDIRRYYSRMFMNTLNSADFIMLQDYYYTFMCGPCKFNANVQAPPQFGIPNLMVAEGPRLMSHYTLGCFVMYPDMVMSMSDSKIVTSNSWSGSKIVMEVEFRATKMYDIELESWLPQLANLAESYQAAYRENALAKAIAEKQRAGAEEASLREAEGIGVTNETETQPRLSLVREVSLEPADLRRSLPCTPSTPAVQLTLRCDTDHDATVPSNKSSPSSVVEGADIIEADSVGSVVPLARDCVVAGSLVQPEHAKDSTTECATAAPSAPASKVPSNNKRKSDQVDDNSSCITNSSTGSVVNSRTDVQFPHIPEEFVHSLFARAKLAPKPIQLLLQGQITMYLDESNHIQHMCETLVQRQV